MTGAPALRQKRPSRPDRPHERAALSTHWLYGLHTVTAALANGARTCHRLLATLNARQRLTPEPSREGLVIETVEPDRLTALLPEGAVHQGLALQVEPLRPIDLATFLLALPAQATLLAVDQVTDPRNLGAILRNAAAFDVAGVILPARRSAELGAACAKAASGALDIVPVIEVANLSQALRRCKETECWIVALDAEAPQHLPALPHYKRCVLVVGAEGCGIRRLVGETCDIAARLPMSSRIASLNVATASGIALYELARGRPAP